MGGVPPPRDAAMPVLPSRFATVILHFAPLFYHRSWRHAEVLLMGAILAPGRRTVASLLRICGLMGERHFVNYHRVLNRAAWSPRLASQLLLQLLIETFAPNGPVVLGLDDTIERRRRQRLDAPRRLAQRIGNPKLCDHVQSSRQCESHRDLHERVKWRFRHLL